MRSQRTALDIARGVFERVRARFPRLAMSFDEAPAHVDLALEIRRQPGLAFDVLLNLQNLDELHLRAGALRCSWFPCTAPGVEDAYEAAVVGLIDGRYRVVEHRRGERVVWSELQRPTGDAWETTQRSSRGICWLIPWPSPTPHVVQNTIAPRA